MTIRGALTTITCLVMPPALKPPLLRALGHHVHARARIGVSIISASRLYLDAGSRIGHLNLIRCGRILLRPEAYIGSLNIIRGPLHVVLGPNAGIGNRNVIVRAQRPLSVGPSRLRLGVWSKITAGHYVDCMTNVRFGDYSTLAGAGSQLWTHGYVHYTKGIDRARVDGEVRIGDNVYIGSASCISGGVSIADGVAVGAHSSVAASLLRAGVYVSQPLRYLAITPEERLARLPRIERDDLSEIVYQKTPATQVAAEE